MINFALEFGFPLLPNRRNSLQRLRRDACQYRESRSMFPGPGIICPDPREQEVPLVRRGLLQSAQREASRGRDTGDRHGANRNADRQGAPSSGCRRPIRQIQHWFQIRQSDLSRFVVPMRSRRAAMLAVLCSRTNSEGIAGKTLELPNWRRRQTRRSIFPVRVQNAELFATAKPLGATAAVRAVAQHGGGFP
jgi:hypothetical protein